MHIRLATEADVPAMLAFSNWAAINTPANFATEPETLDEWMQAYRETCRMHPWLVAVDEPDAVAGFAKSSPFKSRCAYGWAAEVTVYVDPARHGQGIGRALYAKLIPILRAQGYRSLVGCITTPNPASERLHESFGFRRVGLLEDVGWKFDRWHSVGYWQLHLTTSNDTPPPPARIRPVGDVAHELL